MTSHVPGASAPYGFQGQTQGPTMNVDGTQPLNPSNYPPNPETYPPNSAVYPPNPATYPPNPPPYQPQGQHHQTHVGYSSTAVYVTQPGAAVGIGRCRSCGQGVYRDQVTIFGILVAIICFPWGIICCLFMTERRCTSCGAQG